MRHKIFTLKGKDLEENLKEFLHVYRSDAYETHYQGGFLRIYEDYSVLNSSPISVTLRVDTNEAANGTMIIEIITGGASGSRFFDRLFGSERRRIQDFEDQLRLICEKKGITVDA